MPILPLPPPGPGTEIDAWVLRRALYQGAVYLLPATPASRALCDFVWPLLSAAFAGLDPRQAHLHLPTAEVLARVGQVREELRCYKAQALARAVLAAVGQPHTTFALDAVRLRAVLPGGHREPLAAPAYAIHRDTWYGGPQQQINLWLALHDVSEDETVFFLPGRFDRAVANDSDRFDYDEWMAKVGWQRQDRPEGAVYPAAQEDLSGEPRDGFSCLAGQGVIFSAAQLHGTRGIEGGRIRYSLDFRAVHLGDHSDGQGAPNVDSRCTGSSLPDYSLAWNFP